jgi:hypothetical protein
MADTQRRAILEERINALNAAVTEYFRDAHESLGYARRLIANPLDDARMLLDMKSTTPDYFLPMAEMFLGMAERQFASSREMIDRYGGPTNARMVGGG